MRISHGALAAVRQGQEANRRKERKKLAVAFAVAGHWASVVVVAAAAFVAAAALPPPPLHSEQNLINSLMVGGTSRD